MFPRDPLPDRIGPYKIIRRLASRRGADLYLGQHDGPMGFQRDCVLKLVPSPSASGDPGSAEELAHEARICSRLNHPAIVRMFDFFEHGDNLVLVFEHFAGVSLARLLSHFRRRRQRVPDPAVWYLAHRLFSALAHAHALVDEKGVRTPVIHRDIQPAHLVMSQDAHVRLAGFGIAKISGSAGTTAVGFVKGTPAYMAPEQAAGEKITERVDVYAAGLVVWEMLSNRSVRPPRDVGQGAALLKLIAGRRFESISSLRRDIPREIAAAIDACLAQSASKRTIQCREVERWLEKVVDVEAGKKELRERLVQLRNANVRTAPSPRASQAPRSQPPPQQRSMPSRFPGVATRVSGRISEREEGENPRSSRRVPPLRASSYPAPPLSSEHDEPPQTGSRRPKPVKKTLLGMAPAALPPLKPQPMRPKAPSYDALPPPPPDSEVSAFVANLRKPPGVKSVRPEEVKPPSEPLAALDASDVVEEVEEVAPVPPADVVAIAGHELVERPTGDTTIISRRRFDQAVRKRRTFMIAGGVGVAAIAILTVGGWFLIRAVTGPSEVARVTSSSSAAAPIVPVATASVEATASVVAPVPTASEAAPVDASIPSKEAGAEAGVDASAPTVPLPKDMPPYVGAVMMTGPPEGTVYVSGVPLGETGEWIQIACNKHHFVRVGTKPGPQGLRGTAWLAPGQSVLIRCGIGVSVAAMPRYPAPDRRSDKGGDRKNFEPGSPF